MSIPNEIQLKYRNDGNSVITMIIDSTIGVSYKWQHCKANTADWKTMNVMDKNTCTVSNPISGDKYRCLVISGNKVISYSKVLTIGQKKFHSRDEYSSQSQYSYQRSSMSVTDTDGMDGLEFEIFCADVLKKNGFYDVQVTQSSGDYGIDILAKKEWVSYAIQCKCYTSPVGNNAVQEAYSGKSFYNCMVAAVLTNNYFTASAIETAKRNAVVLWNRDYLDDMIRNIYTDSATWNEKKQREQKQRETEGHKRKQKSWEKQHRNYAEMDLNTPDFFKGCSSCEQIKDRYRKLMQMYHPDYETGDEEYAKIINDQYEKLKEQYGQ